MTISDLMDEGDAALAVGELEKSVEFFQQVVELDPRFQDGWHALGMALYKLDRYPEAIEAGLRAAEIDPNNQFVWSSLSLAYNGNKQKTEAEAAGAKARILSWGGKVKFERPGDDDKDHNEKKEDKDSDKDVGENADK